MSTIPSFSHQLRLTSPLTPRSRQAAVTRPELGSLNIAAGNSPGRLAGNGLTTAKPDFFSPTNISSGATVMLQGFEPATIDSVLGLTVGRGGKFTQQGVLVRYQPSGQEPACIIIRAQSGRPPLANSAMQFTDVANYFWQPFRQRLQQLRNSSRLSLCQDLWPILWEATAALLSEQVQPTSACQVEHWFRGWSRYRMTRVATARALLQSAAVATGARPVDIPAGLGEVWRQLQADLQPVLSSGRWPAQSATRLHRFTHEMERIANGPSAETIGQLLGLIRCRLVVTACEGDSLADALHWAEKRNRAQALKPRKP